MKVLACLALVGCGSASAPLDRPQAANRAMTELAGARFPKAEEAATRVLAVDPNNANAAAIRALARYQRAGNRLFGALDDPTRMGELAPPDRMRTLAADFGARLAEIDADLEIAEKEPKFSMDLCLGCWEHDFNRSGEIEESDLRLFQIEIGPKGEELPVLDPRRKPTFRFDVGDVSWARAMVAFQRAIVEIAGAYGWLEAVLPAPTGIRTDDEGDDDDRIRVRLLAPERLTKARELILQGVAHAHRCRKAYLAETDDEREWMPNPSQRDHPVPLPVDGAFYHQWGALLDDVQRLLEGREGLSVAELAQLGDRRWADPPTGFINVSTLFLEPRDLTINFEILDEQRTRATVENELPQMLGKSYVPAMRSSPLIRRLLRMKSQVRRGEESFGRKLRYFLWAN